MENATQQCGYVKLSPPRALTTVRRMLIGLDKCSNSRSRYDWLICSHDTSAVTHSNHVTETSFRSRLHPLNEVIFHFRGDNNHVFYLKWGDIQRKYHSCFRPRGLNKYNTIKLSAFLIELILHLQECMTTQAIEYCDTTMLYHKQAMLYYLFSVV